LADGAPPGLGAARDALCRRHTEAALRQLADWLGLSRADSVPNLMRRLERQLNETPEFCDDLAEFLLRAIAPDAEESAHHGVHRIRSRPTNQARTRNDARQHRPGKIRDSV
jgi:hypothetical protein